MDENQGGEGDGVVVLQNIGIYLELFVLHNMNQNNNERTGLS